MGGAETQTFNRRALPQAHVLKSKKKMQETLSVSRSSIFSQDCIFSHDQLLLCVSDYLDPWYLCADALNPALHPQPTMHPSF